MTESGTAERDDTALQFSVRDGALELFDPIERHTLAFELRGDSDPTPHSTAAFDVPVDDAVTVTASALRLGDQKALYVRENGELVAEVSAFDARELPAGGYSIEFTTSIKTYVLVEGPLELAVDETGTRLEFPSPTEVVVGARSRHENPAATVTTTADPEDVMAAVSTFGSALKTTSPERSFPSLRGHPPLVELGDDLSVPAGVERPETGIEIRVPPALRYVYPVAPLAYYLGAAVRPGGEPHLSTDRGFRAPLDGPEGFEEAVARTLEQVFFLDCVTRTEGLYDVDLHERSAVEASVDLPFGELYDSPPARRLERYLGVPYDAVEEHLPEWEFTSRVQADPDTAELLPFLVDDLSVVRTTAGDTATATGTAAEQAAAVDDFLRDADFTRSAGEAATAPAAPATTPDVAAYHNRLDRTPADGDIDISVVCNDAAMEAERDVVEDTYGTRAELPFDVSVRRNLSVERLREELRTSVDFLHYIGHIDEAGFECADGSLDAAGLDDTGVDAFLLNACTSYRQGRALIDAGAIGGVVTRREVVNSGAVTVGGALASLLNSGFTLRAALDIAAAESVIGAQYAVVGDGDFAIAQSNDGTPVLYDVTSTDGGYELAIRGYPTGSRGMGTVFSPHLQGSQEYYLNSGEMAAFSLSAEELDGFLALLDNEPVRIDGVLYPDGDVDAGF